MFQYHQTQVQLPQSVELSGLFQSRIHPLSPASCPIGLTHSLKRNPRIAISMPPLKTTAGDTRPSIAMESSPATHLVDSNSRVPSSETDTDTAPGTPLISTSHVPVDSSGSPQRVVSSAGAEPLPPFHQPQVQTPRRDSTFRNGVQWFYWLWELCSAFLLLISVVSIPVTLYPHAGKPLPQWPSYITINALLAIYSMVLKSSIAFLITSCIRQLQWTWFLDAQSLQDLDLFSNAAQGPWGSLSWLWAHHFRQPLTAFGAIITVIAIAIDPFIQQLVRPTNCTAILANDTAASVPRTNFYSRQFGPSSLQSSLTSAFYMAESLSDFACESGNCTFSRSYNSLSFCSQCSDRSSDVVIEKQCSLSNPYLDDHNASYVIPGACDVSAYKGLETTSWNITTAMPPFEHNFYYQTQNTSTENGSHVYPNPDMFSMQTLQPIGVIPTGDQADSAIVPFFTGKTVGAILGLSDFAIFGTEPTDGNELLSGCDDNASNDTWRCRGYGAAQCVLQPCVRTYSCSIDNGRINEITVEHSDLDQTWGFGYTEPKSSNTPGVMGMGSDYNFPKPLFGLVDTRCINDDERQGLKEEGYDTDRIDRWLPYNTTFDPPTASATASGSFPQSLLAHGCLYLIDARFIQQLWESLLPPLLVGTVKRHINSGESSMNRYGFDGTQQLLHLYNSGNVSMDAIDATFDNLAQALSLWIRDNGVTNFSRRAEGEVLHYAVCLQVSWGWVALPALLAGGALILFLLTLLTTVRRVAPRWKSSTLPMLFHGPSGSDWVDEDMVDWSKTGKTAHRDVDTMEGIHRFASGISVKMIDQGGQYQLRQVAPRSKKV